MPSRSAAKVTQTDGVTPIGGIGVSTSGGTIYDDNTVTDSAGNYILMGLSPGSYSIYFARPDGFKLPDRRLLHR